MMLEGLLGMSNSLLYWMSSSSLSGLPSGVFGISRRSVSESSSNADDVRYCCSSSLSVDIINGV